MIKSHWPSALGVNPSNFSVWQEVSDANLKICSWNCSFFLFAFWTANLKICSWNCSVFLFAFLNEVAPCVSSSREASKIQNGIAARGSRVTARIVMVPGSRILPLDLPIPLRDRETKVWSVLWLLCYCGFTLLFTEVLHAREKNIWLKKVHS